MVSPFGILGRGDYTKLMRFLSDKSKFGFSTVEVLVVAAVLGMLITISIQYSRKSEQQIVLSTARAALVQTVLRSKALAIQTFRDGLPVCGYGVRFTSAGYTLFRDFPAPQLPLVSGAPPPIDCSGSLAFGPKYSGTDEDFSVAVLDPRLQIQVCFPSDANLATGADESLTCPGVSGEVLFVPPDPTVFFDPGLSGDSMAIILSLADGSTSSRIDIGSGGQVSIQ